MDKKILIYGGSSLISLELIKLFWSENYDFIIFCRNQELFLKRIKELRLNPDRFKVHEIDLIQIEENLKIIDNFKHSINGILWVAGETGDALEEFSNNSLAKKTIKVNFLNPVLIINRLTKHLLKNENSFIAVLTSVAGLRGRQKNIFYGSAKSAMISYLSGLRQKFNGEFNILTVIPGYIRTEKFKINAPKFLITSPKKAAEIIYRAIKSKKQIVYINFLWRIIMFFLRLFPEKLFKKFKF
tara:strand:- start:543 stop:1268 length:726 start_codon:yes stop_codon:yes gene_type:complete